MTKARFWRKCEIRIGGCKNTADLLIHVEPIKETFHPKRKRHVCCRSCADTLAKCGLALVTVVMDLHEVREEAWR